jgi:hypothetical protein
MTPMLGLKGVRAADQDSKEADEAEEEEYDEPAFSEENVTVLNKDNFDDTISKNQFVLVRSQQFPPIGPPSGRIH